MAVTDKNVIDGIAYEGEIMITEIYDHLDFEGKFEFDHIVILQDKINTYLWYIDSKQYIDVYPDREFREFVINIHFLHELTDNCKKFIDNSNKKLSMSSIKIIPFITEKKKGSKTKNHYEMAKQILLNKEEFVPHIPKFPKLEKVVPLPFHEKMNQFIIDYKELSERKFWEKYELNQIWFELNDYVVAIKKLGTLGKVIINVLVDFGFILQLDDKEEFKDYEVENFWGDEPVKLVRFDIRDDKEYYAYIPQSTQLESIFDVKIETIHMGELEQSGLEMD